MAAQIGDRGQPPKLSARLRRFGLVENRRDSAIDLGEPDAWRLTARDLEVNKSITGLDA
ncbi:MAG: hypothetical protein ACRDK4_00420 [Solirubrobacteraceae bacterium]